METRCFLPHANPNTMLSAYSLSCLFSPEVEEAIHRANDEFRLDAYFALHPLVGVKIRRYKPNKRKPLLRRKLEIKCQGSGGTNPRVGTFFKYEVKTPSPARVFELFSRSQTVMDSSLCRGVETLFKHCGTAVASPEPVVLAYKKRRKINVHCGAVFEATFVTFEVRCLNPQGGMSDASVLRTCSFLSFSVETPCAAGGAAMPSIAASWEQRLLHAGMAPRSLVLVEGYAAMVCRMVASLGVRRPSIP